MGSVMAAVTVFLLKLALCFDVSSITTSLYFDTRGYRYILSGPYARCTCPAWQVYDTL